MDGGTIISRISVIIGNNGTVLDDIIRNKIIDGTTLGSGMHIIQTLTKAHGWTLNLEPNSDTEFRLTIPKL